MRNFLNRVSGATSVEYCLIAVLVAISCIAVLETFAGASLVRIFNNISDALTQPTDVPNAPAVAPAPK